ncbi:MAG: carbonic anhydrase, partial [Myxococcales bacterium]|nr:carbonic anhydrase [Myxococcales bacterium]
DSRIDPSLITQTEPGELFICRNAGNIVPPHGVASGEAATIEYAIFALGIKDIIVCGHSGCGAMKAVLEPELVENAPAVRAWLEHAASTGRIVSENYGELSPEKQHKVAVEENVLVQIENLRTLPVVASALVRGDLRVHGWVYKIETGEVFGYDNASGQFEKIGATSRPVASRTALRAI